MNTATAQTSTANTHVVRFRDWMSALRHIAVTEFGLSNDQAQAISVAEVESLFIHGCSPEEAAASLNIA